MTATTTAPSTRTAISELFGVAVKYGIAKFDDALIRQHAEQVGPAIREFITLYRGDFAFLVAVQKNVVAVPNSMSVAQARGIANCMLAEAKRNAPKVEDVARSSAFAPINDGTYTVVRDDESHTTIRFRAMDAEHLARFANMPEGTQIASYLAGPDNSTDFVGCAFVTPNGTPRVWKKFANTESIVGALNFLLTSSDVTRKDAGYQYALISNNCCKCGRKLTVPASIHAGMGPICAGKE